MPSEAVATLMCERLLLAFRRDGFFTHTLNLEEGIHQIRSDAVAIGLRQNGAELLFECAPSEEAFIATAMLDVVAEFEQMARDLRKPVDTGLLAAAHCDGPGVGSGQQDLARILRPETLRRCCGRATKRGDRGNCWSPAPRRPGVWISPSPRGGLERARRASNGLSMGWRAAWAHGCVSELVCAIGLSPEWIAFDSVDGAPVHIIVLTLSPLSQPTPHVQLIARISQVLNAEGRMRLLACHTASEMAALLTGDLHERENRLLRGLRRRLTGA